MNGKVIQLMNEGKSGSMYALTDSGNIYVWSDYHEAWVERPLKVK